MIAPILAARSVTKSFGSTPALREANLAVAAGEVLAIMGPSGSGKSTLLHCLAGILTPDAGEITFHGRRLDLMSENERTLVRRDEFGFVFQFGQLVPELPVLENVMLPLLLGHASRHTARGAATALLDRLELGGLHRRRPGELSGGQAQRVAVARALVTRPKVIFADEPTGSLDSLAGENVMDLLLASARDQGATVVLVTHDARVAACADREVLVRDGAVTDDETLVAVEHDGINPAMIRLALRLAFSGGREQIVRLVVTAAGVGLGVTLLLLAAVTFPAFQAHEARAGWTDTAAHNVTPAQDESRTDTLLWRIRADGFDGRDLIRVDVAPLGPHSPVPPGLTRLPGPGELAVSPALNRLMADVPAAQLADRFPGRVTAQVGRAALQEPDSLVVFVGYDPARLAGQPGVIEIHSIEGQPRNAAPNRFGRVIIGMAAAALLLPILVLIATATRLAAARREQRLAAMRLVGALPRQIRAIAAVESAVAALCGTVLGFAGFVLARPLAARINLDGAAFFPSDLNLTWPSAALIGLGVPALAAAVALMSLRAVQMSPLGVARTAPTRPAAWWRAVPLFLGVVGFVASLPILTNTEGDGALWILAGVMALLIAGIVIIGPWLTTGVGKLLTWTGRRPASMLAGHRLIADPSGSFRSISGLVLAVFLVTLLSVLSAASLARVPDPGRIALPAGTVGAEFADRAALPLSADRSNALILALHAIPGVRAVIDLRTDPSSPPPDPDAPIRVVTGCANLRAAGLAGCADPTAMVSIDARGLISGDLGDIHADAATDPGSLPMLGLLVTTDTTAGTIESVRTAIESATTDDAPTLPWTLSELKGHNNRQITQVTRISNSILLVTLLIAGFSLAVSLTGGLIERKRPFTLLRLAGMRSRELWRVLLIETAAPLVGVAATSAALGLAVAADVLRVNHVPWQAPAGSYWWTLAGGLTVALGVALSASFPLRRMTSLETARFE